MKSKFMVRGRDPQGMKVEVATDDRSAVSNLVAFWNEVGFTDVRVIGLDLRHLPETQNAPDMVRDSVIQ